MKPAPRTRVVLVGPMFGGNVGATARAIKNTGLDELVLVDPAYRDHDEARRFSHGAEEILERAARHTALGPALEGFSTVVGFTARERHRRRIVPLRAFAREWVERSVQGSAADTAFLFGRERDGLTNAELDRCTDLVWIPAHPEHPSYNLAQAVLLCGYELLQARIDLDPALPRLHPRRTKRPAPSPLAEAGELDEMLRHLRAAFLSIGYAYEHTVEPMIRSWHEIFSRARLHRREAAMIRGLAQQILWASQFVPRSPAKDAERTPDPPAQARERTPDPADSDGMH